NLMVLSQPILERAMRILLLSFSLFAVVGCDSRDYESSRRSGKTEKGSPNAGFNGVSSPDVNITVPYPTPSNESVEEAPVPSVTSAATINEFDPLFDPEDTTDPSCAETGSAAKGMETSSPTALCVADQAPVGICTCNTVDAAGQPLYANEDGNTNGY